MSYKSLPNIPSPRMSGYGIRSFAGGLSQAVDPSLLPLGVASDLHNVDVSGGVLKRVSGSTKLYNTACAQNIKNLMKFFPALSSGYLLGCSDDNVYKWTGSAWSSILDLTAALPAKCNIYNSPWDFSTIGNGGTVKMTFDGGAEKTATINATAGKSTSAASPATDISNLGTRQQIAVAVTHKADFGGTLVVRVIAANLIDSPAYINVKVNKDDSINTVAKKIRDALNASAVVKSFFTVGGVAQIITLSALKGTTNDITMSIQISDADLTNVGTLNQIYQTKDLRPGTGYVSVLLNAGTAVVRVTSVLLDGGYKDINVTIDEFDTLEDGLNAIRNALAANSDITDHFTVATGEITLTTKTSGDIDYTLDIALQDDGDTGLVFRGLEDAYCRAGAQNLDSSFKISVDGDTAETVVLDTDGKNTGALVAQEMQTMIRLLGGNKEAVTVDYGVTAAGKYTIKSGRLGTSSTVVITAADNYNIADDLKLGIANSGVETGGTGDCSNIAAVTAAELKTILETDFASVTGVSITAYNTTVKIASPTTGASSTILIGSGTLNSILGLTANTTYTGKTAASRQGFSYDYIGYQQGTQDILIFSNGADGIYKYDGTNVTELDEAPATAKAIELHGERVWVISSGNKLMYSDDLNPENWTASLTEGGFVEIPTWDGETLVALKVAFDRVIVTKAHSIHIITGSTPDNFSLEQLYATRGAIANKTIEFCEMIMPFLAFDGVYYYDGAYVKPLKTDDIKDHIASINQTYIEKAVATYFDRKYILAIPTGSSTVNNLVLEYDFRTKAWTVRDDITVYDFEEFNNKLYYVSGDGYVRQYNYGDTYDGTNIEADWTSGVYGDDTPDMDKTFERLDLTCSGDDGQKLYFDYWIDNKAAKTIEIPLKSDPQTKLGGYRLSGHGTRIKFRFRNKDGCDFTVIRPTVMFSAITI